MTYTLTQEQIAEPQTIREGMCLADWERVPGFEHQRMWRAIGRKRTN